MIRQLQFGHSLHVPRIPPPPLERQVMPHSKHPPPQILPRSLFSKVPEQRQKHFLNHLFAILRPQYLWIWQLQQFPELGWSFYVAGAALLSYLPWVFGIVGAPNDPLRRVFPPQRPGNECAAAAPGAALGTG